MLTFRVMGHGNTGKLLIRARGIATLRGVLDSAVARDLLALLELLEGSVLTLAPLRASSDGCGRGLPSRRSGCSLTRGSHISWAGSSTTKIRSVWGRRRGSSEPPCSEQARRDLRTLREMFELDAATLLGRVEDAVPDLAGHLGPLDEPEPRATLRGADRAQALGCRGLGSVRGATGRPLRQARRRTLRQPQSVPLEGGATPGRLSPDPVSLAELVAYEREREPLIRNTERFLAGLPAHHALLYGLPGTGKSSTVKAIMNEYADRGLRLVEVKKEDLAELHGGCSRSLAGADGDSSSSSTTSLSRSTRSSTRRSRPSSKAASRAARERQGLRHLQPQKPDPGELLRSARAPPATTFTPATPCRRSSPLRPASGCA